MTMKKQKNYRGWVKDPSLPREGETIGGGFIVFVRGAETGRIRAPMYPFEYQTIEAANEQAAVLSAKNPGHAVEVWSRSSTTMEVSGEAA